MSFDPEIHHRRSIRLKEFDYSLPGAYFITIVCQNRLPLFGEINTNCLELNHLGYLINNEWVRLSKRFLNVEIDYFIIMPNHFHGILILKDSIKKSNLSDVIGSFKSSTSRLINAIRKTPGQTIWQRNYYEHIIRNEADLNRVREYIINNPQNWSDDEEFIKYSIV